MRKVGRGQIATFSDEAAVVCMGFSSWAGQENPSPQHPGGPAWTQRQRRHEASRLRSAIIETDVK